MPADLELGRRAEGLRQRRPNMKTIVVTAVALVCSAGMAFAQAGSGSGAPAPQATPSPNGMAQPPGIQDKPKVYQPINPAPDTRTAPTSSPAAIGAQSGGHPENQLKK